MVDIKGQNVVINEQSLLDVLKIQKNSIIKPKTLQCILRAGLRLKPMIIRQGCYRI